MRKGWLRHRLLEWQEAVDDVTLARLIGLEYNSQCHPNLTCIMLMYTGLQHPRVFLRGFRLATIQVTAP